MGSACALLRSGMKIDPPAAVPLVSYFDDALERLPVPNAIVQLTSPDFCSLFMVES